MRVEIPVEVELPNFWREQEFRRNPEESGGIPEESGSNAGIYRNL